MVPVGPLDMLPGMTKPKGKTLHFRCPAHLVELLEADGMNVSATIVRRLLWSFEEHETTRPQLFLQGVREGVEAMAPLHAAMAELTRRHGAQVLASVRGGESVADAARRAADIGLKLAQPSGSPRGGHYYPDDDVWPELTEEEEIAIDAAQAERFIAINEAKHDLRQTARDARMAKREAAKEAIREAGKEAARDAAREAPKVG